MRIGFEIPDDHNTRVKRGKKWDEVIRKNAFVYYNLKTGTLYYKGTAVAQQVKFGLFEDKRSSMGNLQSNQVDLDKYKTTEYYNMPCIRVRIQDVMSLRKMYVRGTFSGQYEALRCFVAKTKDKIRDGKIDLSQIKAFVAIT